MAGASDPSRLHELPSLVLTVGLPKSGKTTWARGDGAPIVNPDAIRLALHGQRFVGEAEPFVWGIARVMVAALFRAGHGRVIVDATNTTRKRRAEWRSERWRTSVQTFAVDRQVCLARAHEAEDEEIVPVIHRMADQFEPPDEFADSGA